MLAKSSKQQSAQNENEDGYEDTDSGDDEDDPPARQPEAPLAALQVILVPGQPAQAGALPSQSDRATPAKPQGLEAVNTETVPSQNLL